MSDVDVSVIIPVKNIDNYISAIIKSLKEQTFGIHTELILVDMRSSDKTMITALKAIKALGLNGFVVQNGTGNVTSALNTGICKATGKYLTFLFPRRIYSGVISEYFATACENGADFVYGCAPGSNDKLIAALKSGAIKGTELITGLVKDIISIDIGAVLISKNLFINKHLLFNDNCKYGYAEEFVYKLLLKTDKNFQSHAVMNRALELEPPKAPPEQLGIVCFDRVEALLRMSEIIKYDYPDNKKLKELFEYDVLPGAVFDCIDLLLKEGFGYSAVKNAVKLKGYEDLLVSGKGSNPRIRKNLVTWKLMPWMYKPKK